MKLVLVTLKRPVAVVPVGYFDGEPPQPQMVKALVCDGLNGEIADKLFLKCYKGFAFKGSDSTRSEYELGTIVKDYLAHGASEESWDIRTKMHWSVDNREPHVVVIERGNVESSTAVDY